MVRDFLCTFAQIYTGLFALCILSEVGMGWIVVEFRDKESSLCFVGCYC